MASFVDLEIWKDASVIVNLHWYFQVATNQQPAKHLLATRVPLEMELAEINELPTKTLWEMHKRLATKQLKLQQLIQQDPSQWSSFQHFSPNLLDLNLILVDRMLQSCSLCEWKCGVNRKLIDSNPEEQVGTCQLGESSRISSYFHHRGEELVFRGTKGSGTIFFTSCSMRCRFCQNGDISSDKDNGVVVTSRELAEISVQLRLEGCHNVNYVGGDPSIHLHTILRAIAQFSQINATDIQLSSKLQMIKADYFAGRYYQKNQFWTLFHDEISIPVLWNSNNYSSSSAMQLLHTVVDIWLPDFKFGPTKSCANRLSRTPRYFETVTRNLQLLHDKRENVAIRHLVMPNHVECCSIPILEWIHTNTPQFLVNIMGQYHPDMQADPSNPSYLSRLDDINRRPTPQEIARVVYKADELGINYKAVTYY